MTQTFRWLVATSLFLILIIIVEYFIGWVTIISDWKNVSFAQLAALTLLTLLSYLLRAERVYQFFSNTNQRRSSYVRISFIHNALNNFLPMRLGEAAFPILMKRELSESMITSSAGLILIRFMDLHVLLTLSSVAFLFLYTEIATISLVLLAIVPWLLIKTAPNVLRLLPNKIALKLVLFFEEYGKLSPKNVQLLSLTYLLTTAIWIVKLSALISILMIFIDISFIHSSLAIIAADLSGVLPIHGLAGSGTYEASMMSALYPLGYSTVDALKAAINVHVYMLGVSAMSIPLALLIPKSDQSSQ